MINYARRDGVAKSVRIIAKCHDSGLVCKRAPERRIEHPITPILVRPGAASAAVEAMNHDNAVQVSQLCGRI